MDHELPPAAEDWKSSVRYAGFVARVVAAIIDTIVLMVPLSLLFSIFYHVFSSGDGISQQQIMLMAEQAKQSAQPLEAFLAELSRTGVLQQRLIANMLMHALLAVAVLLLWNRYAATPGKMLFKMRIVDADTGREPTKKQNFGRYMGYFVSTAALCIGFVVIIFSKRKQGWHDKMANTAVVYTESLPPELRGGAETGVPPAGA